MRYRDACPTICPTGNRIIPTLAQTEAGFWLDIEPVEVVSASDGAAFERPILSVIERRHPQVPRPTKFGDSIVLKYAQVKSWSQFRGSAVLWRIALRDGRYVMGPYRKANGRFELDSERQETLPVPHSVRRCGRSVRRLNCHGPITSASTVRPRSGKKPEVPATD
jgi:hypothetical protein